MYTQQKVYIHIQCINMNDAREKTNILARINNVQTCQAVNNVLRINSVLICTNTEKYASIMYEHVEIIYKNVSVQ